MLGLDKIVLWSFSQGVAEGGHVYFDAKIDASAEFDTETCCVEVKLGYHVEGGIGYAKGRKWKRGLFGVQFAYEYKFKGALVEFLTDRQVVLFKLCPGKLSANWDEIIFEAFFGGHVLGELAGEATVKPAGVNILAGSVHGVAEAKGGITLGIGVTATASWAGPSSKKSFSIDGNVWLNANIDSHVVAKATAKLILFGKWEPVKIDKQWIDIDPDHVGWRRKPIVSF